MKFTTARLMGVIAVLAIPMGCCLYPIARMREWRGIYREIDASVRPLTPTNPGAVVLSVWDCAHVATITAVANVCYSEDHVSLAEMVRFRDDLDQKLKGTIDLDTLAWIWDRLAQTGPHGKQYVERLRVLFEQCLPPKPGPGTSQP